MDKERSKGIGLIGADNTLVYFNDTMRNEFGWSDERMGKNVIECHKPENQSHFERIIENFRAGRSKAVEMVYMTQKRNRKLLTRYSPIYDSNGTYVCASCVIQDITIETTQD